MSYARSTVTRLACLRDCSLQCILLLLLFLNVEGFAVYSNPGRRDVRAHDNGVQQLSRGGTQTRSSFLGASTSPPSLNTHQAGMVKTSASSSSKTTMSMGPMGGGGNEHTDKRDPQEETEDSSGLGIDYLSKVRGRDWRLFRKNLIREHAEDSTSSTSAWAEGCWAHELGKVEPGCLLLATEQIWDGPFHQSVILILSHDHNLGTVGLIINRPGAQQLHSLAGLNADLAQAFADSQVFDGGPVGLGSMTVIHAAERVEGSEVVLPGVYAGGFDSLVHMTRQGGVAKERVRFIHGHSAWSPGQLQGELNRNQWFIAAAAPELVTADCSEPSNPLWAEVLRLMGGRYREVAQENGPMA